MTRPINRLGNIPSAVPGALMTSSWLLFALQWSAGKRRMGVGGAGEKKHLCHNERCQQRWGLCGHVIKSPFFFKTLK